MITKLLSIGDRVRLRYAPVGVPGRVLALANGKAHVRWDDLELTTRHSVSALRHAAVQPEKGHPAR